MHEASAGKFGLLSNQGISGSISLESTQSSLVAQMVKNLPAMQETHVRSLDGKIPWRKEWQPTPIFLPGELHGQRSLAGFSLWNHKESDMTE